MAECCSGGTRIIYACSGQADVGELSDRIVRELRNEGFAKMACLAGVGAGLSGYVQSAKGADAVVTVDGCSVGCARKNMERIGVVPQSYVLTDMGLEKGSVSIDDAMVKQYVAKIKETRPVSTSPKFSTSSGCGCGGGC